MTAETRKRKKYIVRVPTTLTLTVWAFSEADAQRQASQSVSFGWPEAYRVEEADEDAPISREAASL